MRFEGPTKIEWALQRGGRSAHSFSWLLSSPQQPLETEDPPTVSLAPQYTSQHLCRAIIIFLHREMPPKVCFLFGIQLIRPGQSCNFFTLNKVRTSRSYLDAEPGHQAGATNLSDSHDCSLPSAVLMTSARALACDLTSLSLSPSIMTRARDSVPE